MVLKYLEKNYKVVDIDVKSYWASRKYTMIDKLNNIPVTWFEVNREIQVVFALSREVATMYMNEWFE